jgi:hypothetical protein
MLEAFTHAYWNEKESMPKISNITSTADSIADRAYAATATYPAFDANDRLEAMLSTIRDSMEDLQADVIAACRKKAGVK